MIGIIVFHKVLRTGTHDRFTIDTDEFSRILCVLGSHGHIVKPGECYPSGTSFILTFDDGTEDHYALINSNPALKCLFFINTGSIGNKGHLEKSHICEMQKEGHIIGSHSHRHIDLTKLSEKSLTNELETSVKTLEDITGREVEWFAPPEGIHDQRVIEAAEKSGIRYFRTTNFGIHNSPLSGAQMSILNTMNIGRYFMADQLDRCLSSRISYLAYCVAYRSKNYIKKHIPAVYRKVRHG